ncbi:MAG: DUF5119 domain-containing protein [Prevotellaceae bacterium]|jgi:hypothetical protein|nr:DUF5119 domain-containing protein [Prevotellaceae bacterium]
MHHYQAYPYEYDRLYKSGVKRRKTVAMALWVTLIVLSLLFGCVEGKLESAIVYDPEVHLIYDWPEDGQPTAGEGLTLHLFPMTDGRAQGEPVSRSVTPFNEYSVRIPAGSYSILAYNADAQGVEFLDTDDYERATVCALTPDGRVAIDQTPVTRAKNDMPLLGKAGNVYSVWSDDITSVYSPYEELRQEIHVPVHQLAAPVHISIENKTDLHATRVQGTLNGLVLSRRLCGGDANIQEGMGAYAFDESFAGGRASTTIPCLGLHNPMDDSGKRYNNLLELVVEFEKNLIFSQIIDISEEVAENIDEEEVSVALKIDVQLEDNRDGIVIATIAVTPWDEYTATTEFY